MKFDHRSYFERGAISSAINDVVWGVFLHTRQSIFKGESVAYVESSFAGFSSGLPLYPNIDAIAEFTTRNTNEQTRR